MQNRKEWMNGLGGTGVPCALIGQRILTQNKIIANQTNLSTANESIKLNKMTSTGDMKPSDVHSEKTGRPIYGAAAEAAKGHLMGAAAANVEGNLQGAAKQRHEEKLARERGEQADEPAPTGYTPLTEDNTKPHELHGVAAEAKKGHLKGAAAANRQGKLQGAAAEAHEDKIRGQTKTGGSYGDESGIQDEPVYKPGEDPDETVVEAPGDETWELTNEDIEATEYDTAGLQGAAAEAPKQKVIREGGLDAMEAKESGGAGRGFDRQGNLIGAAKQAHEAKMAREEQRQP